MYISNDERKEMLGAPLVSLSLLDTACLSQQEEKMKGSHSKESERSHEQPKDAKTGQGCH